MASESHPSHLQPSKLGTKEYWDQAYTVELRNHANDPSDQGTIWFEDSGAEDKVLAYLEDELPPFKCLHADDENQDGDVRILDLGTGNGHMLFELNKTSRFQGKKMIGVDFSEQSVTLSREIKAQFSTIESSSLPEGVAVKNVDNISFELFDIMKDDPNATDWFHDGFDLVLDKGTFDAISLSSEVVDASNGRACEEYPGHVERLVKKGGFVCITSCNWTEEELVAWFCRDGIAFKPTGRVGFPKWRFGGLEGSSVVCVIFKRM